MILGVPSPGTFLTIAVSFCHSTSNLAMRAALSNSPLALRSSSCNLIQFFVSELSAASEDGNVLNSTVTHAVNVHKKRSKAISLPHGNDVM